MNPDDDAFDTVQRFVLAMNDRIDDLFVRVEALRRAVGPVGLSQQQYEESLRAVQKELQDYRDRETPKLTALENGAQIRRLLEKSTKQPSR